MAVEIQVLGPVGVANDGADDPAPAGPAQRRLLAMLCVNAGRVVPSEWLAEELGLASVSGVRTAISRVRQLVGDVVHSDPPGYVVSADTVDAQRFLRLLTEARSLDPAKAIERYDEALDLWHGPAFMEFADEEWAQAEAVRLDELYATAREERIDALLTAGRFDDAAADVERLIRDHPLRERPRGQLMLALTNQGRSTEALRSYQRFRSHLGEEIGVEPSAALAALEARILAGEVDVSRPAAAEQAAPRPDSSAPNQRRTLTFLFTDIERSTERWEADADAMARELERHDSVLRSCVESKGGLVFKHTGDGICAAFSSAKAAVEAAIDAQNRLELPVRMGISSGEAQERDGDFFGTALNRAARVMSAGHGGQIVVAASTAGLVDGIDLRDLGEQRLRDIPGNIRLFQVVADGLADDFEPLRTVDARVGNVESPLAGLIGREKEVEQLLSLVGDHRLVTLTGVGGVGKTTLALHAANELRSRFSDGVWIVELASIAEPIDVPDAFAAALGINQAPGATVTESIVAAVAGQRMLIVVDNCEHVLAATGDLIDHLLGRTWTIHLLATSREPIGLLGEHCIAVPTLDFESGADAAAVRLFVERALAVAPDQRFDSETDLAAIAEVCRRLDGIALAIELAAARMVSMSIGELDERLDDRFRLLTSADRRRPHHQTLREAVSWSYDLLDEHERALLDQCSLFVDGFDLAAAAALGTGEPLDEYETLDLLESLVRKSLVTTSRSEGSTRYEMLETIRQFSSDRLLADDVVDRVRDRHLEYFAREVERWWEIANSPAQRQAFDWLDAEFANLRAAFRWAVDSGQPAAAATVAAHTVMIAFPMQRFEALAWVEEVLEAATAANVAALPRLLVAGGALSMVGKPEQALALLTRAAELRAEPGHRANQGESAFEPGWIGFWEGIAHRYAGRVERYVEISRRLIDGEGLGVVIGLVGLLAVPSAMSGAPEVHELGQRARDEADRRGIPYFIAFARAAYGRALAEHEPDVAMSLTNEALDYAHEHHLAYFEATIARDAATLEVLHGDLGRALDLFDAALAAFHRDGNHGSVATTFASLASVFDRLERLEVAATVYGAYRALGESLGIALGDAGDHLREVLGAARFDEARAAGAAMDLGEAMHYARHHVKLARESVGDTDELGQPG